MQRASLLVPLVVFMVIVSGCLGESGTSTSTSSLTPSSRASNFAVLYPENPRVENLTPVSDDPLWDELISSTWFSAAT